MTMESRISCPKCGHGIQMYRNPIPTTDIIIIRNDAGVILIKRKNPPLGWALPGGFIDYGETAESAAKREAKEETGLDISGLQLFGVYSEPDRDPRHHTISVVYRAVSDNMVAVAGDDAVEVGIFVEERLPYPLVFDHEKILRDYFDWTRNCCERDRVD